MDWSTIIRDIQAAGYSQKQIAEFCGCSQGLISQIKNKHKKNNGKSRTAVSFELGTSLLKMHQDIKSQAK